MDLSPVIQCIFTFSDKSLILEGSNNFQTSLPHTMDRYLVKCKKSPEETESDEENDEHLNKKKKIMLNRPGLNIQQNQDKEPVSSVATVKEWMTI